MAIAAVTKCPRVLVALPLAVVALGSLSATAAPTKVEADSYRILLSSNRDGATRAYSMLPDGSLLTPLVQHGRGLEPLGVSRDGSTIAYGAREGLKSAIYVARADGSGLRRVVPDAIAAWGRVGLSRDGRLVAFERGGPCDPPTACTRLSIVGADGHGLRRLAVGPVTQPDFSPDGRTVAYARQAKDGAVVLQLLNGKPRVLVHERGATFTEPKWSPDGRWIAFRVGYANPDKNGLYLVRANGTRLHRLSKTVGDAGYAAWSPDSSRLAFTIGNSSHDVLDVAIAPVAGGGVKALRLGLIPERPVATVWAPNGRELIVAGHDGDDPAQVWRVGVDGRMLRRVTSAGSNTLLGWTRLSPRLAPTSWLPSSERVLGARSVATSGRVAGLAADGSRVAFVTGTTARDCAHVAVWTPTARSLSRMGLPAPCEEYSGGIFAVALAGSRVAWTGTGCGNYCDLTVESATLRDPTSRKVSFHLSVYEAVDTPPDYHLHGHGGLLVVNDGKRLVSIGAGHEPCTSTWSPTRPTQVCKTLRRGEHSTPVDSVAARLIAIRERNAVVVLDAQGKVVRAVPFPSADVKAAVLDGGRLIVARAATLESYDVATGARVSSRTLPSGSRLTDAEGNIVVLQSQKAITLLRLADGRSYSLPSHAQFADLEPAGLYFAYAAGKEGRVAFVPHAEVVRQLG